MSHELTWLLVAIPAVSAAILLLGGKATNSWGHLLGTAAPLASFVCGVLLFFQMQGRSGEERSQTVKLFEWFSVGSIKVDVTLLIDPLSILFVLLITGVGSLIHIYSIGYMADD
ncbi:MAG TPA: NADH-quinone oxidoreductase subunit L, partial [Kribbella sp.]